MFYKHNYHWPGSDPQIMKLLGQKCTGLNCRNPYYAKCLYCTTNVRHPLEVQPRRLQLACPDVNPNQIQTIEYEILLYKKRRSGSHLQQKKNAKRRPVFVRPPLAYDVSHTSQSPGRYHFPIADSLSSTLQRFYTHKRNKITTHVNSYGCDIATCRQFLSCAEVCKDNLLPALQDYGQRHVRNFTCQFRIRLKYTSLAHRDNVKRGQAVDAEVETKQ